MERTAEPSSGRSSDSGEGAVGAAHGAGRVSGRPSVPSDFTGVRTIFESRARRASVFPQRPGTRSDQARAGPGLGRGQVSVAMSRERERAVSRGSGRCSGAFRSQRTYRDQVDRSEPGRCSGCSGTARKDRRLRLPVGSGPGELREIRGSSGAAAGGPAVRDHTQALDVPGVVRETRRRRQDPGRAVVRPGRLRGALSQFRRQSSGIPPLTRWSAPTISSRRQPKDSS
jgi:hypothetical protein